MIKKIIAILLITLTLLLFLGCAEQPPTEQPPAIPEETPSTSGEVDQVGAEITDINNADEELDASDLDDLDTVLKDIENI